MTGTDDTSARPDAHLSDIADGCGCAEVWEHTSAAREEDAESDEEGRRGADADEEMRGVDVDGDGVRRVEEDGGVDADGSEDGVDTD